MLFSHLLYFRTFLTVNWGWKGSEGSYGHGVLDLDLFNFAYDAKDGEIWGQDYCRVCAVSVAILCALHLPEHRGQGTGEGEYSQKCSAGVYSVGSLMD